MNTSHGRTLSAAFIRGLLVPRIADGQKYDFGHVMIVAGSRGITGSAVLCAHGALRSGAGLVTLAVPSGVLPAIIPALRPEVMTLALPEQRGDVDVPAVQTAVRYISARRVSSLVLGPGMGTAPGVGRFLSRLFATADVPMVLDADALNAVSRADTVRQSLLKMRGPVVMTPHEGELGRLLRCPVDDITRDRVAGAVQCAQRYRVICVLKGRNTVITDGKNTFINPTGNPGMATGGSGDVLAGMTGALYAQVREPRLLHAALVAAFLHGSAGDSAAKEKTQIAMIAGDIIEHIPQAIKKLMRQ